MLKHIIRFNNFDFNNFDVMPSAVPAYYLQNSGLTLLYPYSSN